MPGMARDRPMRWLAIGGLIATGSLVATRRPALGLLIAGLAIPLVPALQRNSTPRPGVPVPDGGSAEIEMVVAIIRPGKLNDVKRALAEAGAPSLTVTNVSGRGTQPTETAQWRGSEYIVDLHQKVKIECAVSDDETATVVEAIREAANTGEPGDGKIFVMPICEAYRVSTGEQGLDAM